MTSLLPTTLHEWRQGGREPDNHILPRTVWDTLEQFFQDQGLTLWKSRTSPIWEHYDVPPNDLPRCPDPFAYRTKYNDDGERSRGFAHVKAIHCPARTTDNLDVLIRIIAIGNTGLNHIAALRRIATGPVASRGDNHVVPVLREIICGDMIFAIFPLMNSGFERPWYYDFREVVDAVKQVLEGIAFCHERLVAHLDIDSDNILINFEGGKYQPTQIQPDPSGLPAPFRTYFPVRYYINDFELAVCFDEDSDPSTRRVTGLPTDGILQGKYGRDAAPEMFSEAPYCPFLADVWQLGRMFDQCFGHLSALSAPLAELFVKMKSDDPLSRPTALQALDRVSQLRSTLSPEILTARVPRPPKRPHKSSDEEA